MSCQVRRATRLLLSTSPELVELMGVEPISRPAEPAHQSPDALSGNRTHQKYLVASSSAKKGRPHESQRALAVVGCGGRIRTSDHRVMSPGFFQTELPRVNLVAMQSSKTDLEVMSLASFHYSTIAIVW